MKSQQIIDYIAHSRECTAADITGKRRHQHLADGRSVAQYVLREALGWTWHRIADTFHCDHSSGIANWKKVRRTDELMAEAQIVIAQINVN